MGRTVMIASDAKEVIYLWYEPVGDDVDEEWRWREFKDNIVDILMGCSPALEHEEKYNKWMNREVKLIAGNGHCSIGLSEYCGMVALSFVPAHDDSWSWEVNPLAYHWIAVAVPKIRRALFDAGYEIRIRTSIWTSAKWEPK